MSAGPSDAPPRLTLDPIGYLRSSLETKVQAARQPRAALGTPARIELLPGRNFEHALEDLAALGVDLGDFLVSPQPGMAPEGPSAAKHDRPQGSVRDSLATPAESELACQSCAWSVLTA